MSDPAKHDPSVAAALDLTARLKTTVADFAAREDALVRAHRTAAYAAKREWETGSKAVEAKLKAGREAARDHYESESDRAERRFEARGARIDRAYRTSRQFQRKSAENAKGNRLNEIQVARFKADAAREEAHAANEAQLAETTAQLAGLNATFADLRKRARRAFFGYVSFLGKLPPKEGAAKSDADTSGDEPELLARLRTELAAAGDALDAFEKLTVPKLFRFLPVPVLAVVLAVAGYFIVQEVGADAVGYGIAAAVFFGLLLPAVVLHRKGASQGRASASAAAAALRRASALRHACDEKARTRHAARQQAIGARREELEEKLGTDWAQVQTGEVTMQQKGREKVEAQVVRVRAKNETLFNAKLEKLGEAYPRDVSRHEAEAEAAKAKLDETYEAKTAALEASHASEMAALAGEWDAAVRPLYDEVGAMQEAAAGRFPAWSADLFGSWSPPEESAHSALFGHLAIDVAALSGGLPEDARFSLPGPVGFELPLALSLPRHGSLLLRSKDGGREAAVAALNDVVLRLLATTQPGKLSFTIFDPVGLGESFAGLMHLADYEDSLINSRVWTQGSQLEERLADLAEHIEKVIQMYLRNEYETITEYNRQAGTIAEKYHFLVLTDFPSNVSDLAAKRLQSIVTSGARCGVFTLVHWDERKDLPQDFDADELVENSVTVTLQKKGGPTLRGAPPEGATLTLEQPPSESALVDFVHKIGQASKDTNRVEVPFSQIAPAEDRLWERETTRELVVPIGRTGATKLQELAIGKGTRQHALFAGKTGSGKSTLFHVIITNLALYCSPEEVEFYLIDFKKGVEFKAYATKKLPHAKVIAIESDREFALSVLQRLDEELKRRGDLFRQLGVQDLAGYKKAGGSEPMPRSLLLIDEFQEYFVEDDRIAQNASVLLDRIVRQGRAFGIHVLLGSQTLGGAYTLARTTLGQMVIRVALMCNEADAYLIMDDNNPAPRLLSRPGEGIYNDAAGTVEGNSPFQVCWLGEDERDHYLDLVRAKAQAGGKSYSAPIVFEGNAPADVRENAILEKLREAEPSKVPVEASAYLGAPNSIKGPTEAVFRRQSGHHLLIIGQRDEAALAMVGVSIVSLAHQFPKGSAKFVLFDSAPPGAPEREFLEAVAENAPQEVRMAKPGDLAVVMQELTDAVAERADEDHGGSHPSIFLVIHGLQKFKKLRQEDDFDFSLDDAAAGGNPAAQFTDLVTEGSSHGIHVIATVDTFNNINRFMTRKTLSEFEMRVLFQMSANDSASLVDSPAAGNLGLHRALFYNEHEGYLETFRPYALPPAEWLVSAPPAKA